MGSLLIYSTLFNSKSLWLRVRMDVVVSTYIHKGEPVDATSGMQISNNVGNLVTYDLSHHSFVLQNRESNTTLKFSGIKELSSNVEINNNMTVSIFNSEGTITVSYSEYLSLELFLKHKFNWTLVVTNALLSELSREDREHGKVLVLQKLTNNGKASPPYEPIGETHVFINLVNWLINYYKRLPKPSGRNKYKKHAELFAKAWQAAGYKPPEDGIATLMINSDDCDGDGVSKFVHYTFALLGAELNRTRHRLLDNMAFETSGPNITTTNRYCRSLNLVLFKLSKTSTFRVSIYMNFGVAIGKARDGVSSCYSGAGEPLIRIGSFLKPKDRVTVPISGVVELANWLKGEKANELIVYDDQNTGIFTMNDDGLIITFNGSKTCELSSEDTISFERVVSELSEITYGSAMTNFIASLNLTSLAIEKNGAEEAQWVITEHISSWTWGFIVRCIKYLQRENPDGKLTNGDVLQFISILLGVDTSGCVKDALINERIDDVVKKEVSGYDLNRLTRLLIMRR